MEADQLLIIRKGMPKAAKYFCELINKGADLSIEDISRSLNEAVEGVFMAVEVSDVSDHVKNKVAMYVLYAVALDRIFEAFENSISDRDMNEDEMESEFWRVTALFCDEEEILAGILNEHFAAYFHNSEEHTWNSQLYEGFVFAYRRLIILKNWLMGELASEYASLEKLDDFFRNHNMIVASALRQAARFLYVFAGNVKIYNVQNFPFNGGIFAKILKINIDEESGLANVTIDKEACAKIFAIQDDTLGCPALYMGLVKKLIQIYCDQLENN